MAMYGHVWLELLAEFQDIGAEPAQSHTPPKYGARNGHISRAAFVKKIIFKSLLLLSPRPLNVFKQTLH